MTEFKVGDTVKVKETSVYYHREGKHGVGRIIRLNKEQTGLMPISIKFSDGNAFNYHTIDLELVNPVERESLKVGDIVELVGSSEYGTGTLKEIDYDRAKHQCFVAFKSHPEFCKQADLTLIRRPIEGISRKDIDEYETGYEEDGIALVKQNETYGGKKMEAPKTQLEKNALINAKNAAIEKKIAIEALKYEQEMNRFIENETLAQQYRGMADEARKVLGITDADMKDLF